MSSEESIRYGIEEGINEGEYFQRCPHKPNNLHEIPCSICVVCLYCSCDKNRPKKCKCHSYLFPDA